MPYPSNRKSSSRAGTNVRHGGVLNGKATPEYNSYTLAKSRCNNPNNKKYPRYGGRGIEFRFNSFEEFLTEVGLKPTPKHTIDRIDNDGHYEIGNVKWSTPKEQQNNLHNNIIITVNGESRTLPEWASLTNQDPQLISSRKKWGWCHPCLITGEYCAHRLNGQIPHNKLNATDIPVIRQLAEDGVSHKEISRQYNVTRACISRVVSRKNWKHIK